MIGPATAAGSWRRTRVAHRRQSSSADPLWAHPV